MLSSYLLRYRHTYYASAIRPEDYMLLHSYLLHGSQFWHDDCIHKNSNKKTKGTAIRAIW